MGEVQSKTVNFIKGKNKLESLELNDVFANYP